MRNRGLTLIELTVLLAVAVTGTLILAPTAASNLHDAQVARARSDVQTIADAITELPASPRLLEGVDVLVGPGSPPLETSPSLWTTSSRTRAWMDLANADGGPRLALSVGPDPWGNRYTVNAGLLEASPEGHAEPEGPTDPETKSAVWVISAGPNGRIETRFSHPVTTANLGGDDIGLRLQ